MPIRSRMLFAAALLGFAFGGERVFPSADDVVRFVPQPVEYPATGAVSVIDAQRVWVGLAYTADGAASWTGWKAPSTPTVDFDLGVPPYGANTHFLSAERGWMSGANSVWATDDGASTWRRQMPGHIHAMAFVGDTGWLAAGDGRSVENYTTRDQGRNWRRCGPSWKLSDVAPWSSASFLDATEGWITIGSYDKRGLPYRGGVAKTPDGGCTWNIIWRDSDPGENLGDIHFVDAKHGWLFSYYGRLLASSDGGIHWQAVGLPDGLLLEGAYLESATRGWILGSGARGSGLYYTSDGGALWHLLTTQEIRDNSGMAKIPMKWGAGFLRVLRLRR